MKTILKKQGIVLVVIITALLSCFAIGLTSAKYYSKFTGNNGLQTAKFDVSVSASGELTNFSLSEENPSACFDFSVTSTSEVAVTYDVVITLPTGATLPDGVTFEGIVTFCIGKNIAEYNSTGLVYTIKSAGSFTAIGGTNEHILTVTAIDFSSDIDLTGIQIQVVATQVEPTA